MFANQDDQRSERQGPQRQYSIRWTRTALSDQRDPFPFQAAPTLATLTTLPQASMNNTTAEVMAWLVSFVQPFRRLHAHGLQLILQSPACFIVDRNQILY